MNNFFASFSVGFLCTLTLFALCFLIVLGGKTLVNAFKSYASDNLIKEQPTPTKTPAPVKTSKPRKPKTIKSTPKPVKSIEIDPLEIDRIYVKKSS